MFVSVLPKPTTVIGEPDDELVVRGREHRDDGRRRQRAEEAHERDVEGAVDGAVVLRVHRDLRDAVVLAGVDARHPVRARHDEHVGRAPATLSGVVTWPMPSFATTQWPAVRKIAARARRARWSSPSTRSTSFALIWSMSAMTASSVVSGVPPKIGDCDRRRRRRELAARRRGQAPSGNADTSAPTGARTFDAKRGAPHRLVV